MVKGSPTLTDDVLGHLPRYALVSLALPWSFTAFAACRMTADVPERLTPAAKYPHCPVGVARMADTSLTLR